MPFNKPCLHHDCPNVSRTGWCPTHANENPAVRRHAKYRGPTSNGWRKISRQVIAEEGACRVCGHTGSPDNPLTCDHIVPLARGGTNDRSNLQCLCRRHNSSKGGRERGGPAWRARNVEQSDGGPSLG